MVQDIQDAYLTATSGDDDDDDLFGGPNKSSKTHN